MMTLAEFYRRMLQIAPPNRYTAAEVCVARHADGSARVMWRAYWSDQTGGNLPELGCRSAHGGDPLKVLASLREGGDERAISAEINAIGAPPALADE